MRQKPPKAGVLEEDGEREMNVLAGCQTGCG